MIDDGRDRPARAHGRARERVSIGDYGVVGDTRTNALISPDGAIDWMCLPRFDGAPVFGALVGGPEAGTFQVAPTGDCEVIRRRYDRPTMLTTTWRTASSEVVLRDAMIANLGSRLLPSTVLVRRVEVRGAACEIDVVFDPVRNRTDRPRRRPQPGMETFVWGDAAIGLCADRDLALDETARTTLTVEPSSPLTIVMTYAFREPVVAVPPSVAALAVEDDQRWWESWLEQVSYDGPWGAEVRRSLVALKLLTFSPSGAPVAAGSSSLPEQLGGPKNWDYRYAWPRDAALGVGTFLAAGLRDEARSFFYWLLHATRLTRPRLPPALTLFGNPMPAERRLDWPGYAGSQPVRHGNVVGEQRQLDVYGFVLDAASILTQEKEGLYAETWRALRGAADHVAKTWREPGSDIWEERGEPRQWVHSKLLAWLALDRAEKIGRARGEKEKRLDKWRRAKSEIRTDVFAHGFDERRCTFVREYGSGELDAALLLLPLIGIEPPDAPAVVGTVDAIRRELHGGGPLYYRHGDRHEGAFVAVSFWLAQALALTGRPEEAEALVDEMVQRAGPLGLFAEEIDVTTGEMLGNHPQALSHAALLQAVFAIRDVTTG